MVSISINLGLSVAVLLALLGAVTIYRDGKRRGMDTADMWAVGFVVGFFLLPIVGGVVVAVLYLQRRADRGGRPSPTPYR